MEEILKDCKEFSGKYIKDKSHKNVYEYGLKILDKFYISPMSICKTVHAMGIVLHDVLNHGCPTKDMRKDFGDLVVMLAFNISEHEEDKKLEGYEKNFDSYDSIFSKLIIRISKIHNVIEALDSDKFKEYIAEHNGLRRKLLKGVHSRIMVLMDYESDLIKYGRNVFSGKPAASYKYENLIIDA